MKMFWLLNDVGEMVVRLGTLPASMIKASCGWLPHRNMQASFWRTRASTMPAVLWRTSSCVHEERGMNVCWSKPPFLWWRRSVIWKTFLSHQTTFSSPFRLYSTWCSVSTADWNIMPTLGIDLTILGCSLYERTIDYQGAYLSHSIPNGGLIARD